MSNVDNDLKNLLPYLNELERQLDRERRYQPVTTATASQNMFDLKKMVADLESKVAHLSNSSPHLSRTMPTNLSDRRVEAGNLRQIADRLRAQIDAMAPRTVPADEYLSEDENNLSLNHEMEYGQGEFKRLNHSMPVGASGSRMHAIQNLPNNFRPSTFPSAPRPIQLNDNLSNRNYSARTTNNKLNNEHLVDLESRLEGIRSAFDKIEQLSENTRFKRQDHVNRQIMQDLAQNREELAQLEQERRSLQRMSDHLRPKAINNVVSDYHSVLAEQGTPRTERQCSLEQLNRDADTATVILERMSAEDSETSRLARVERLLVQAFEKIDRHEQELFELKRAEPSRAEPHTSTPGPLNQNKKRAFFHKDQQIFLDKRRLPTFSADTDELSSVFQSAKNAHAENAPFFVSMMALIGSATTDELRTKMLRAVQNIVGDDDDTDSIGTVSDDEEELQSLSERAKEFLSKDLTQLVKDIIQPIMVKLIEHPEEKRILKMTELEEICATILSFSGVMGLKSRFWKQFIQSIRDPMLKFVGKIIERDTMILELSELLYNEIHYIRTILSGKPCRVQFEDIREGEVDRHVSYNNSGLEEQKNIELSVAEVQALTCYGSGEDEESDGGSIDEKNEIKNPETAINESEKDVESGSSSPVVVENEKDENISKEE